ncbi:MAG: histidine phosphatase family protein, partial [Chloroflexi bacterium]|nr:histidine phosphatase family protein [Chloroflexota bacterium]
HGETEWNVAEIFRGRIDVELNETGLKQAALLAQYLSQTKIQAIYSSPLKRASQTAEAIARLHQLKVTIAPALIDFNFGQWQGLSVQEVKGRYPELFAEWVSHPDLTKIPGGESLKVVRERAMALLGEAIARYAGTVVLVSHRVVNKVLICALLGLDNSHFWQIKQDTCGITTFTYENGQFILDEHNNTSYLKSLQKAQLADF